MSYLHKNACIHETDIVSNITNVTEITVKLRVYIIGYYGHYNIGDEQYKESFKIIFDTYFSDKLSYTLDYVDCDKLNNTEFLDTDIILLGGGDILNDYFLDKIIAKFSGTKNKLIGVSVGLPYKQTLTNTTKLNIMDYIFIRTKQDMDLFSQYFHPHRVLYLPDLSIVINNNQQLQELTPNENDVIQRLQMAKRIGKKIVCLSLNRHIRHENYLIEYRSIIQNLGHFIKFLVNFNFHILFLPLNTNSTNSKENDILIHRDVIEYLTNHTNITLSNITSVEENLTMSSLFRVLDQVDICVPMRFHMCLFAIYKKIPFFPLFTTRKIRNLLLDIDWQYGYEFDVNHKYVPMNLDINVVLNRFMTFYNSVQSRRWLYTKLTYVNTQFHKYFNESISRLFDVITLSYSKSGIQSLQTKRQTVTDSLIYELYNNLQIYVQQKGYLDFRNIEDDHLQDIIVCIVSYNLTNGSINSVYNYGLKTKMFNADYNYVEEWKWILNHISTTKKNLNDISNPNGIFNIKYIDQVDYSGAHRSGWQYVYDSIKFLHNDNAELLLDLYVDRTFHWNGEINSILGIVPYTKPWMGFVHHTFDTSFSVYNCYSLLENENFLKSLPSCRGLIVLSNHLKSKFDEEFSKLGINVNIYVLMHPTDANVSKFSFTKFLANDDKKLLHVGGWLRNVYAFYNLSMPKTTKMNYGFLLGDKIKVPIGHTNTKIRKVALKGKNMNNYYPELQFGEKLHGILVSKTNHKNHEIQKNISQNCSSNCSSEMYQPIAYNIKNNWYRHFYNDMADKIKSVDFIEHLDNDLYDDLLTRNIIFIYLIDASAVNTVIECMVRNTPIIINRHPAVVELLGENYPLYVPNELNYTVINETARLYLKNANSIKRAHIYMKRLDKRNLNINSFVSKLIGLVNSVS